MTQRRYPRFSLYLIGLVTISTALLPGEFSLVAAQSGNPIRVAYDQGNFVIKNVGSKPIAAFNGVGSYQSAKGNVYNPTLSQILPGALFRWGQYLKPGEEWTVPPVPAAPNDASRTIEFFNVTITGVVFADGTVWGVTGDSLRRSVLAKAGAAYSELSVVLKAIRSESLEDIEELLKGPGPIIQGQDQGGWLHGVLKRHLLDQTGHIYPDAIARLTQMIEHLGNMIDR